jgi:hypothetical protein
MFRVAVLSVVAIFSFAFQFGCTSVQQGNQTAGVPTPAATPAQQTSALVSREGVEATEPAIAVSRTGVEYIAYVEKDAAGAQDLFVSTFYQHKKESRPPVRVNPKAGEVKTWYGDPPTMAVGSDGVLHVGWTAKYPDGAKGTILYHSVSSDEGRTFSEPVRINEDSKPASHGMHSMAIAPDGRVFVAWLDERYLASLPESEHKVAGMKHGENAEPEPNAELYFSMSQDGGKTFSSNKRIATDVCPCCKSNIAVKSDGEVFVAYRKVFPEDFRHIAIVSSKDGNTFNEPVMVSDDRWQLHACPVSGPALRMDGDALVVAWFSGGEAGKHGLYTARASDTASLKFDAPVLIASFEGGGTPAWSGGRLFWTADGQLHSSDPADSGRAVADLGEGRAIVATQAEGRAMYAFVGTDGDRKSVRASAMP